MQKRRLSDLSEAVRSFLAEAFQGDGLIIEDDEGQPQGSLAPYDERTMEQRQQALKQLQKIQGKVQQQADAEGKTVEEFEQLVFEDE